MRETSTTENLLLYLFNETEFSETVLIQRSIDYNPEVECEFENIKNVFQSLDKALVAPSPSTVSKILAYSAASASVAH